MIHAVQNTLEDLHNLMLATGTDDFSTVADTSYLGKQALNSNTNWQSVLGGSNDDALVRTFTVERMICLTLLTQWIVLALWKIGDYKSSRGLSSSAYTVSLAQRSFYSFLTSIAE